MLVLGYPDIARLTTRTPLTLTRGILSGFTTQRNRRVFLQFDAGIVDGNSGGALARIADGALIGVPSDRTYSETNVVSHNFARPLSLVPDEWLDLIVSRGGRGHSMTPMPRARRRKVKTGKPAGRQRGGRRG